MAGILQDTFTYKLLQVITELTKRAAKPRQGVFAKGLGITNSDLNKIERGERNVREEKQAGMITYLAEHHGVNRNWWKTPRTTEVIFDFNPATRIIPLNKVVKIDFMTLQKYQQMEQELDECRKKVAELQGTTMAAEPETPFDKKNPDTNPDKDKKKN